MPLLQPDGKSTYVPRVTGIGQQPRFYHAQLPDLNDRQAIPNETRKYGEFLALHNPQTHSHLMTLKEVWLKKLSSAGPVTPRIQVKNCCYPPVMLAGSFSRMSVAGGMGSRDHGANIEPAASAPEMGAVISMPGINTGASLDQGEYLPQQDLSAATLPPAVIDSPVTATPVMSASPAVAVFPVIKATPVVEGSPMLIDSPAVTYTTMITVASAVTVSPVDTESPMATASPAVTEPPMVTVTHVVTKSLIEDSQAKVSPPKASLSKDSFVKGPPAEASPAQAPTIKLSGKFESSIWKPRFIELSSEEEDAAPQLKKRKLTEHKSFPHARSEHRLPPSSEQEDSAPPARERKSKEVRLGNSGLKPAKKKRGTNEQECESEQDDQEEDNGEGGDEDEEPEYEVEKIVSSKLVGRAPDKKRMYKVRWLGFDVSQDTWENEEALANAREAVDEYNSKKG
ncbi:hypothetical protein RUND412_005321 [Rhizina undulata]